jgi:hypothetical protein
MVLAAGLAAPDPARAYLDALGDDPEVGVGRVLGVEAADLLKRPSPTGDKKRGRNQSGA